MIPLRASKLENADGFWTGGGELGEAVEGKLRPLNASVRPPKASDCFGCGWDCTEEKEPNDVARSCCGADCGCCFGGDAYNERIDCFRSGRDNPVGPELFEGVLEGRLGAACVGPKKSSPNKESPGLCCFGGGTVCGAFACCCG